jgi:hypothetical protein
MAPSLIGDFLFDFDNDKHCMPKSRGHSHEYRVTRHLFASQGIVAYRDKRETPAQIGQQLEAAYV